MKKTQNEWKQTLAQPSLTQSSNEPECINTSTEETPNSLHYFHSNYFIENHHCHKATCSTPDSVHFVWLSHLFSETLSYSLGKIQEFLSKYAYLRKRRYDSLKCNILETRVFLSFFSKTLITELLTYSVNISDEWMIEWKSKLVLQIKIVTSVFLTAGNTSLVMGPICIWFIPSFVRSQISYPLIVSCHYLVTDSF